MLPLEKHYFRLEPCPQERQLQAGFEARVHDPVWFLTRQWQMGEHQGENASSPVTAAYRLERSPIQPPEDNPAFDPQIVPAEVIVESELDDWWTMGRRIRAGRRVAMALGWTEGHDELRFFSPPPPYEHFQGTFDGRAIWHARARLGIADEQFAADRPPAESPLNWDSAELHYATALENAERRLLVEQHHGGPMDWYSADGDESQPLVSPIPADEVVNTIPTPLAYPGAPQSRFWQIEDTAVDIGGYPPDTAHLATMLLVDLVYSHGDDWFLFPVTAHAGQIITMSELTVTDSFGRTYSTAPELSSSGAIHTGLLPPEHWTLFASRGLHDESVVLWHVAELPLQSAPIERVQFGVDEHSNLLWAVERIIDGRDVDFRRLSLSNEDDHPPYPPQRPAGNTVTAKHYFYLPGEGIEPRWHPYELIEAVGRRQFVQRGLADLSRQRPMPMPRPEAELLKAGTPEARTLHIINPAAMPPGGIEIERRWMLARDAEGKPALWIQRQRKPLRTPPARSLRFDVLVEQVEDD